jgi:hypothetical protein
VGLSRPAIEVFVSGQCSHFAHAFSPRVAGSILYLWGSKTGGLMVKLSQLASSEQVLADALQEPGFRQDWDRTAFARAVAEGLMVTCDGREKWG